MSTTNLFVELIVIGAGAACWALPLLALVLGLDPARLPGFVSHPGALVPVTALIYLLGILTDRLADTLANSLVAAPLVRRRFGLDHHYFDARAACLANGGYPAQQFEYNRSRQRICRGWLLNSLVLLGLLPLVSGSSLQSLLPGFQPVGAALLLTGLALACGLAWWRLLDTELKRLHDLHLRTSQPAGEAP
jgi:hypothetical protein